QSYTLSLHDALPICRARRKGLRLDPRGGMTEPYVRDFQAFASNGAAGAPPWLREIREGAIARFTALGFPTMKQEAWRFTSVAPIDRKCTRLNSSHVS